MSTTARKGLLRQGDVLLIPIDGVPDNATAVDSGSRLVLAEGEATGHAHTVLADQAQLVEAKDGTLYLMIDGARPASLVHEEHDTIPLSPGSYEVRHQREYVPPAPREQPSFRWVAD
jgi:hypothetical protein